MGSFGYFIYDIFMSYYGDNFDLMFLFHHIIMLISYGHSITKGNQVGLLHCVCFFGELSGPFLLLHQNFNFHSNLKTISKIAGIIFCHLFIFLRFGIGIKYMVYPIYSDYELVILQKLLMAMGYYVSLVWLFAILNKLFKGFYEATKFKVFGSIYGLLSSCRKHKNFQKNYNVACLVISFAPVFYFKSVSFV